MRVTVASIAKELKLSPATVSRVLNGKGEGFISQATRERVTAVAKERGYRPNLLARALVTGRTGLGAIWVRNPDAPYYARLTRALQDAAVADNMDLIIVGFRDTGDAIEQAPKAADWPVDGIIAVDVASIAGRGLDLVRSAGIGIVCMGNDTTEADDTAAFDIASSSQLPTQHLIEQGRRHIVHLTAEQSIRIVRNGRERAYEACLNNAGLEPTILTAPREDRAAARETLAHALRRGLKIDALTCINDDVAIGAYRALRDAGMRIPDDVALVGCDDIEDLKYFDTPISSVRQPVEELARETWRLFRRRADDINADMARISLAPQLVIRESSVRGAGEGVLQPEAVAAAAD